MGLRIRISITAPVSGSYVVLGTCKLVSVLGSNTEIPGINFSGSSNIYYSTTSFENCYNHTDVWHSSSGGVSPQTPLVGEVEFSGTPTIAELVIQCAAYGSSLEIDRSPKDFTVSKSLDNGLTWTVIKEVINYTNYTIGQATRFQIIQPITVGGTAVKAAGGGAEQVAIHNWATRELTVLVTPDATTGEWEAEVFPDDYSITYSADGCQPICHGPYTITES